MNNSYPNGIQPSIIWRLTSTLITIEETKHYLTQWLENKTNEKAWLEYILNHVGIAFEYAIIVEEQLSKNYLIADRLIEFYHIHYKYNDTEKQHINTRQAFRIYNTLYKATFKFWLTEIKRLNKTPEYLIQNATAIINKQPERGKDNIVPYFISLLETIKT